MRTSKRAKEKARMALEVGNVLAPAPMMEACEKVATRPSKAERRAKLIAAHVALEAVCHDLGDYAEYEAINKTQHSIAAAIGRLELRD